MRIRKMVITDVARYRDLRLQALADSPTAFGSSVDEQREHDLETYIQRIPAPDSDNATFVAESADQRLTGMIGFSRSPRVKMRHKGSIWSVYVEPAARGKGVSRALMDATIAHARQLEGLRLVVLNVVVTNFPAIRLYESYGFEIWGTEPEALYVDGRYYDEHYMTLRL